MVIRRIGIAVVVTVLLNNLLIVKVSAAPTYTFPLANCAVKYGKYHHDYPATDIFANKGCAFVAPISGVIDEVNLKDIWSGKTNKGEDRGGLSVSMIGSDGVRYYGSHLSKIQKGIAPGVAVKSGDKLGEVGSTGSARGTKPHLHFGISWPTEKGIWWVRRGMVSPWNYLNQWKMGKDTPKIIDAVNALKLKKGEIPTKP